MTAQQRRQQIIAILTKATGPVSASALAGQLGVSRQIVVGDVALLRAGGEQMESPLYGEITGRLHVASRYDADNFVARAMEQPDGLLLRLTGGVHLHTLVCPDEETFLRIRRALAQAGILYEK